LRETGHPVPDARCEAAARAALALVARVRPADVLLVLLSGGASSLLACPSRGLSLDDIAKCTSLLLAAGADIEQMNAVRKHLSEVSGGRLAAAAGAGRIEVLVISDVPGDRFDVIGSGPFSGDPTTFSDARAVFETFGLTNRIPRRVAEHLAAGARGEIAETPTPGAAHFDRVRTHLLASNFTALEAAGEAARKLGWRPVLRPGCLRGEARNAGRRLAALAAAVDAALDSGEPRCLVAGGETIVTVRGAGRGGRNQELALAAASGIAGRRSVAMLAAGTDGGDGPTDAAGAFADAGTVARGRAEGVSAEAALADNDSNGFFRAEGGLFVTGPTGTNVMDLALVVIDPASR
jgi:glycerate-2-kinase